jgi:hypothetical protein
MWVAECSKQDANLVEREFAPRLAGTLVEFGHHGVELFDGSDVRHGKISIEEQGSGITEGR